MTAQQKPLYSTRVLDELACIKPDEMTPLQALAKIAELRTYAGK